MPMIDLPATPVAGAEVVMERRVGEAGNRGLSPVVPVVSFLGDESNRSPIPIEQLASQVGAPYVRNLY